MFKQRHAECFLRLFCIWISYVSLSDYKVLIQKFYTTLVCLHGVTNCLNKTRISSKHVSIFLPRNYDVISQLCHSYTNGPFCVARLILLRCILNKNVVRTLCTKCSCRHSNILLLTRIERSEVIWDINKSQTWHFCDKLICNLPRISNNS